MFGEIQRAWVGALGNMKELVLGRRSAGTLGWDWACWKASLGKSESPDWLWKLMGAEGQGASGKMLGAPRRWRCTLRLMHHWGFEEVLSKTSRFGEALGSVEPDSEKGGGGG